MMSSVLKDPYAEVDMLALEPVPELNELLEWEPLILDDPELDPALLLREVLDPAAAMGVDTLLV
jgi:hypothetical protein